VKKFLLFLGVLVFVVVLIDAACAMQSKVIEKRNEYGGQTEEETYSIGDDKYKDGLAGLIIYYDGSERIIKLESIFQDDRARLDGVQRSVQFFDNRLYRPAVRTRVEFYYTGSYSDQEGIAKVVQFYDEEEKRTKADYLYTDAYAKKRQIYRLEVQYDNKGNVINRSFYDRDGRILSSEDSKTE
jgi:hypothetical protein